MIDKENISMKILETLTEQIAVIDENGEIVYVNKSWVDFGRENECLTKPSEWQGINYLDIIESSAKDGDMLAQQASKGIKSIINKEKNTFYLEYPCHSPDEKRWFMMRVTSFELDESSYCVLSHHNITERVLAENELSENFIKLKNTQNIMVKQSREAAMGEILSLIGHHWRQPLTIISSLLSNLILSSEIEEFDLHKYEESVKYQKYVNDTVYEINDITQALSKTINSFRALFDKEASKEMLTLKEVCQRTFDMIDIDMIQEDIEVIYDESNEKFELILGDMIQTIFYIIKNAQENFQNNKTQNPKIKITTDKNTISICDNGGGVPENIVDKIFEPYFSTKKKLNGTGLGLYLSKIIIEEQHNGKLFVKNQDSGACFTIIL